MERNKNKKKSSKEIFKLFFLKILFLFLLGVTGWSLFFSYFTQLKNVEIISDKVNKEEIKNIVDNYRSQFRWKYFSNNNFFFFPRKEIEENLKDNFKLIRTVDFENIFPDKVKVILSERQAIVVWSSQGRNFLMDETGEIFYEIKGDELLERFDQYDIIFDKSNPRVQTGQKIEDGELVNSIITIKNRLKEEIGLELKKETETPSLISKEIRFKTEAGWEIYFNINNDIDAQIILLREILESDFSQKDLEKLEYIDLRISEKAIYKVSGQDLKGEDEQEENED